jgi:NitT/TauT family transport system substrate-binding protein
MQLPRHRALQAFGAALAAPALAGAPAPVRAQQKTVRVGTIPVDVGANCFYTSDLGLFAKAGLDVQISPGASGPAIAQAVAGGALEVGVSNVATIAAARLRGLPFRFIAPAAVVAPGPRSTDVVMVLKDSPITAGAGMNGKLIAINGLKDLQEIEARGFVDRFGGDSSTIRFAEIPFPAMGGALEQKRVDVIFPTEPFSTADTTTGKVIGNAFDGVAPRFMLLGYFASETWLQAHPDVAAKFVSALREGSEWANAHRTESGEMLVRHTRMTADVIVKVARATYGLSLNRAQLVPVIDLAVRYGILTSSVSVADLVWQPPRA